MMRCAGWAVAAAGMRGHLDVEHIVCIGLVADIHIPCDVLVLLEIHHTLAARRELRRVGDDVTLLDATHHRRDNPPRRVLAGKSDLQCVIDRGRHWKQAAVP